ncbi:Spondin-1 [Labeo rohita]|uniref:Spondin-1 n=1 Tax=Labeo rohita TaxID=84645 RepID=A0ABQ8LFJ0_LABRO|nr:Spondin-1 [Labeo rohita]
MRSLCQRCTEALTSSNAAAHGCSNIRDLSFSSERLTKNSTSESSVSALAFNQSRASRARDYQRSAISTSPQREWIRRKEEEMLDRDGMFVLLVFFNVLFIHTDAFRRDTAERQSRSEGGFCRIWRTQTRGARRDGQNEFRLRVEGDPETYQPGSTYRVSLYASSPSYFRGFTLIALKEGREGVTPDDYAGTFKRAFPEDAQGYRFWTAPPSGSGCVTLKASVVQRKIIFFQDEGSLTKRLCEKDPVATTEKPIQECCACGTAKYRVTFYGNWSEKVHPKDYPRRANHWSALIGASHSRSYVLWEYGGFASEGVKQVAEYGSPVKMEEEIRQKVGLLAKHHFTIRHIAFGKAIAEHSQPKRAVRINISVVDHVAAAESLLNAKLRQ